jgi:hypothetical protein
VRLLSQLHPRIRSKVESKKIHLFREIARPSIQSLCKIRDPKVFLIIWDLCWFKYFCTIVSVDEDPALSGYRSKSVKIVHFRYFQNRFPIPSFLNLSNSPWCYI